MANVIYGLNINQYLSEVIDKSEAMKNLGIDVRDLDVIRDISTDPINLNKEDLRLISNLKSDVRAVLFSLRSSASFFPSILSNAPIANFPVNNNIFINGQLSATAYKYNYYDFNTGEVKSADISTSRNSSWSSFETVPNAPIFYGGDLEIIPSPSGNSILNLSSLNVNSVPEPLVFAAQEPTHLIKMIVNGVEQEFYAMKGIPLIFEGFFRTASFAFTISRNSTQPRASLVVEYLDNNEKVTFENLTTSSVNLPDFKARAKLLKFYYNPARITRLILTKMMISSWPSVILPALATIDISINDYKEMPNFNILAPSLKTLNIYGNDLTRGETPATANEQLNRLPTTIESINIDGCFGDSTPIDLTAYTNLKSLSFNSNYTVSSRNSVAGQRMTDTGSTPAVSPNNLISYNVTNQRYTKLHASVTEATNLQTINIGNNRISADSNNNEISLASTELRYFYSSGNPHNLVNVNSRQKLINYYHTYGGTPNGNKTLGGTFQGCQALQQIILYATYVEGDIGEAFANLPLLNYLDLRFTSIHGKLTNNTFKGSTSLRTILIQGSRLGLEYNGSTYTPYDNFADSNSLESLSNLQTLYIIGNRNIKGNLPNLSLNKNLSTINIQATDFSGGLQNYNSLPVLRTLIVRDCKLSQGVPAFNNNSIDTIRLEFNRLTSDTTNPLPEFSCSKLKYFSINNNLLGGPIPSYANCPNLETIILSNNRSLVGYTTGSLELCTKLTTIDFSNCGLNRQDIQQVLSDLRKNYDKNKRRGVRVNLLGNNYVLSDIVNSSIAGADLNYLRAQGWSITI